MSAREIHPGIIPATGLTVVVPRDNPTLDIVFVHGFTGHPERTWKHKRGDSTHSEDDNGETSEPPSKAPRFNPFKPAHQSKDSAHSAVYWPRDLLPATLPNARVFTYGYDTHIRHWASQPVNRNTVRDIAWDFLVALEACRREEPARPLLFVVHSLGGIVVKELLRRSSGCRQGQTHLLGVFQSTVGIMFFGTPHGGTDPRGILQHAAELLIKAVGFNVNQQIVNTLLPSSERLRELRDEFSPMAHEQQWIIHSFQEELGVKALGNRKVVEDTSSYLNFPAIEITEHIGRNHMDMCRFSGPEDVEYKKVAAALQQMTTNLPETRTLNTSLFLTQERREKLRDSLAFDQIDSRYATIQRAHIRTCKWLEAKDEYLDWLNPNKITEHQGLLWIKGNPGTGKSTLMKFALDQAQKTMKDKVILSFFFNARGEELERSTAGMYRSLLLQLLRRVAGLDIIFNSLRLTAWPQNGQIQWSIESLKDLFEQAVQNLGRLGVVCFIDALDECNEDQVRDMLSFFEYTGALAIASNIRFQVCLSSRHYPYITITRGLGLVLEGQEGHGRDIADYINSELKIGHSTVAEKIRAELQTKASGVFMWVVLVVSILNKEYDCGRIHVSYKRLHELPDRLNDLFREILTRDSRNRDELLVCIQWVLFAQRPLKPEELYFAILARTDHESLAPWDRRLTSPAIIEKFIIDSSKGLAETTKSRTPVVQFIHESVRDFLLKDNGLREIWPDLGDQLHGQSHKQLKECCLKYICLDIAGPLRLPKQLPEIWSDVSVKLRGLAPQSFPFLKYAICGVLYHTDKAESEGISQDGFLQSFPLKKWIYFHNLFRTDEVDYYTPNANLLHQAVKEDYLAVAKLLVKAGANTEATNSNGLTPLSRAAQRNSFEIAELLIRAGANKEAMDVNGLTPLLWAVRHGSSEVAELLIKEGANKEAMDERGLTPLLWAVRHGSSEVAELLITAGADKETKDINNGQTPLFYAAARKSSKVAELLIKAGANKEAKDRSGLTPLFWAVHCSSFEVAALLIEAGADNGRTRSLPHGLLEVANRHVRDWEVFLNKGEVGGVISRPTNIYSPGDI
ncbi:hypothetical protein F4803DRAFT_91608 [Xylaria telfairii]|nr:hypothetical protein F4803DRAFT_91608 [Xylaria telfairii]